MSAAAIRMYAQVSSPTPRERAARNRQAHFVAAAVHTGTYEDRTSPYMLAARSTIRTESEGWFDRNPARALVRLRSALDNFSGYCGDDDAIGDHIAWLTRFEYVFRPDIYGADYSPRW